MEDEVARLQSRIEFTIDSNRGTHVEAARKQDIAREGTTIQLPFKLLPGIRKRRGNTNRRKQKKATREETHSIYMLSITKSERGLKYAAERTLGHVNFVIHTFR